MASRTANKITGANSLWRSGFTFMVHLIPLVAGHARLRAVAQFYRSAREMKNDNRTK
jgi:hypothetical protein